MPALRVVRVGPSTEPPAVAGSTVSAAARTNALGTARLASLPTSSRQWRQRE